MTREEFRKLSKSEQKVANKELLETIKKALEGNEAGTEALKVFKPSLYGLGGIFGKSTGTPKYKSFGDMFINKNDEVDEMSVFQLIKAGRHECNVFIKDIIRKSEPKEIKWISFNPETGIYKLIKIGQEPPKDWTGFVPIEKSESPEEVNLI
jgi:hypothetical protein